MNNYGKSLVCHEVKDVQLRERNNCMIKAKEERKQCTLCVELGTIYNLNIRRQCRTRTEQLRHIKGASETE